MTEARQQRIHEVLSKRQNDLTLILENVFDVHNISAIMRTCDAVGIQEIFVIFNRQPPPGRWGYRSSGGAYKWITVHSFSSIAECVAAVRKSYQLIYTTHLADDSVSLFDMNFTGSMALVFGNEQKGVSHELAALSDGNFVIPQMGMIRSLNISVACAITLYEAFRQKKLAGHYDAQKLSDETYAALQEQWSKPE